MAKVTRRRVLSDLGIRMCSLVILLGQVQVLTAQSLAQGVKVSTLYEAQSGDVVMALTGDSIVSRPLMPFREERYLRLRDLLLDADVRFTNGETLFHNYEHPPGFLTATYSRADPRLIKDLQWLGINLMGTANNHALDFGENGVLTNIRNLDEAGMVHAGTGSNYAEAIAPGYLETPKGRVALIAATATYRANNRAGEQRRDMKGRPGANIVRWANEWTVDKEAFDALKRIAQQFRWGQGPGELRFYGIEKEEPGKAVYFADKNPGGIEDPPARFVLGTSFERRTRIHQEDLKRNLRSIQDARRMADWVIYSIHSHEGGKTEDEPAEHVQVLAHAAIDAGADLVVGHGQRHDRGVEIYKGKPILYSIGNFIMQWESALLVPQDSMVQSGLGHENTPADFYDVHAAQQKETEANWQSAIFLVFFKGKKLREVKIYPIEQGFGLPRTQGGRPVLAQGDKAQAVLQRFQRLSEPFKTKIGIEGDIGVIHAQ